MVNYKNKLISIIGSGKTGISCIDFFLKKKSIISLLDTRINPPNINLIPKYINTYFGNLNINILSKSYLIVVSPGFNASFLKKKLKNIEIVSDIEIFCRENRNFNIIAITGTNGKSTVVSLIYEILKNNNYSVYLGGNIGFPILYSLNKKYDFYILELSSFQLETIYTLKTIASSVLNIGNDHLNRHLNMKNYINSKLKIYKNSSYCVINYEDILSYPKKINLNSKYEFFGINYGNYHLKFIKNNIFLMYKNKLIINSSKLKLFGIHNYINILSALAIINNINTNMEVNLLTIKNFFPLNHRLNIFLEFNKIKWINDSKSTNLCSLISAINSFKIKTCIHLILGGDRKNINFLPLKNILKNKNIKLYCFGKDGKYINDLFKNISIYLYDLESIILKIFNLVNPYDIVLFSPACSSTDQYLNYEERGFFFMNYIKKLYNI